MSVMTNKERHAFNAGTLMRKLAIQTNHPIAFANDMYILGCCHETPVSDFVDYPYLTEIKEKNNAESKHESPASNLLNFAEIHIDEDGTLISTEEKLKKVEMTFGKKSAEYAQTQALILRFCTEELEQAFLQIDKNYFESPPTETLRAMA